jgi:hypothetical protein
MYVINVNVGCAPVDGMRLTVAEHYQAAYSVQDPAALLQQDTIFSGHTGALGNIYFCTMPVLQRWDEGSKSYINVHHTTSIVPL